MNQVILTKQELMAFLEVSDKTVENWLKKGCPRLAKSKYDLKAVLKWRGYLGAGDGNNIDLDNLSLQEQKLKYDVELKKSQSQLHDLKLKLEKGDYLLKAEVLENLSNSLIMFKKSLLNLESKLAMDLGQYVGHEDQRKIASKISDQIKDCLNTLAKGTVFA